MKIIDINCDMGEGMGHDEQLMPFIDSANIACGFHAGDADTIKRTILLCLKYNVQVGAHPSFNDKVNFGRTEMHLGDAALFDLISEQLYLFSEIALALGAAWHHVKPHGALYNMAAKNNHMSHIIAQAVLSFGSELKLYGLAGSALVGQAGLMGLKTAAEAFADRTYQANGLLTARTKSNAFLTSASAVRKQVLQLVQSNSVTAVTGEIIPLKADTVCLHGDGAKALQFAAAIHEVLHEQP